MRLHGFIDKQFESIAEYSTQYDERIFPIDLRKVSALVLSMCEDESMPIIAVGSGALEVLAGLSRYRSSIRQDVQVLNDSRDRTRREVVASSIERREKGYYFVDDVAVSGNTLRTALEAAEFTTDDQVVVGLEFNSHRLRQRIGVPVRSAVMYEQLGSGRPAMNSISTLLDNSVVADEYARVKGIDQSLFQTVMKLYKEEV